MSDYQQPYGQNPQYQQPQYQQNPQYQQPQYQQNPQYQQPPYGQAPYGQAPYGQAPYGQAPYGQNPYGQPFGPDPKAFGYYEMITHILLCLFTCGIWTYIWIYRTTKTLSNVYGFQPQDATTRLLLCLFVPFYVIFWLHDQAKRAEVYARNAGVHDEIATMVLLFAFLCPIVSYYLVQNTINKAAQAMAARAAYR